jgi:hypothetical protein
MVAVVPQTTVNFPPVILNMTIVKTMIAISGLTGTMKANAPSYVPLIAAITALMYVF